MDIVDHEHRETDYLPLGVIAAATPTHVTAEQHAAFGSFCGAERCDAAGRGIGVRAPDFLLQFGGEHHQLMAVRAEQAHRPRRAGVYTCEQSNAVGKLR